MAARPYNNTGSGYLPNGATGGLPPTGAAPLLPNQGRVLQTGPLRVLCIADVRGNLRSLNDLAKQARADHIIHTGDFGFYDDTSLERIAEKTLKHVAQYSPLISEPVKKAIQQGGPGPVKNRFPPNELPLSELPLLISGEVKLDVPVYTVWGACEDVRVLEKFRTGEYKVPNLHIIDEARSMLLEVGGVKLRLLGLGGAVVMHKLFDNGEGRTTIAGGQGTMWTTLLQMGELVDTAHRVYDPTETRIFVTHASPAREGILNQLSVTLKADFSISAGLHFRYGSSYNEFSVNPTLDHYRGKLAASKASFNDVWETVKGEVEPAIQQNEAQQNLLKNALQIVEKMPTTAAGGNPLAALLLARLLLDRSTRVLSRTCGTLTLLMLLSVTWSSRSRMAVSVQRCGLKASTSPTEVPSSSPASLPLQLAQLAFPRPPLPLPSLALPLLPADSPQQFRLSLPSRPLSLAPPNPRPLSLPQPQAVLLRPPITRRQRRPQPRLVLMAQPMLPNVSLLPPPRRPPPTLLDSSL
ncbi:hypothetical protein SNK04_010296 [Fusarium graminearum]